MFFQFSIYNAHTFWGVDFTTNSQCIYDMLCNLFAMMDKWQGGSLPFHCHIENKNLYYEIDMTGREKYIAKTIEEVSGYIGHVVYLPDYICEENILYFHGASLISKDSNKAIVLLGSSNAGKTTLCCGLVMSGKYLYGSDDIVAINLKKFTLQSWKKGIYIRDTAILYKYGYNQELLKSSNIILDFDGDRQNLYNTCQISTENESILSNFYLLNRNPSCVKNEITELTDAEKIHYLLYNLRNPMNLKEQIEKVLFLSKYIHLYRLNYHDGFEIVNNILKKQEKTC